MNNLILYEKADHVLYAHVNKLNKKVYFGITKSNVKERWGKGSGYKKGTPIKNAIEKYGWDSFEHIIIRRFLTHNEALEMEKYFIRFFKSQNKKIGYNVDKGGKDGYLSAEARRKSKEAGCFKEVICLETGKVYETATEAAQTMGLIPSSVMKVCNSYRYILFNYHFMYYSDFLNKTEDEILKIKNKVPKCLYDDNRKVITLETGEIFKNAKEAVFVYSSTTRECVIKCCKHEKDRYTAGGVQWMFLSEYESKTNDELRRILKLKNGIKASKPVINLETMQEYESIQEASRSTGISIKTIRYSCKGTRNTRRSNGRWVFKKDYDSSKDKLQKPQ